ncbi:hypothetical protein B566_EDAN004991 [Ephemera danica]|nr:hypothetical protein B566_EDAN004991 [Ephemera danica]
MIFIIKIKVNFIMNVIFNVKTLKIVEYIRRSNRCKMLKEVLRHHSTVRNSMAQMSTSCGDSYEEAVKALNSLQTNAAVLQQAKKRIGQPNTNVAETRKFLARSGVSQETLDSCLSVIHVAGTKGKEPLSKEAFTRYFWEVFHKLSALREHDHDMPPYFKFLTVMAFNVFLKERVDVAIVEVGIGGELDCTNVIRFGPYFLTWQYRGTDSKAEIWNHETSSSCIYSSFTARTKSECTEKQSHGSWGPVLGLDSQVQQLNASLAVQLSHAWLRHHNTNVTGLRLARWPGRAQILPHSPNICFFLDGAHTSDSIENCQQWFLQASEQQRTKKPVKRVLIFNSTGERSPSTLLKPLCDSNAFQCVAFCPNLASNQITSDQSNFMVTREQQQERATLHAEAWSQIQCPELEHPEVPCEVFSNQSNFMVTREQQLERATLHAEAWSQIQCPELEHPEVPCEVFSSSLHLVGCALGLLEPPTETQTMVSDEQNHQRIAALPLVGTVH